jgi:phosphonate ABC transporter permease subunit PhnE
MGRTPRKSRSVRPHRLRRSLADLRPRALALLLDWATWGYVAYGVMYLLNYYWYKVHVNYYGTLTVPPWGWLPIVLGTFELAVLGQAMGQSLGLSLFGLRLLTADPLGYPKPAARLARWLAWHVSALSLPVQAIRLFLRKSLLHDQASGTRMFVFQAVKNDVPVTKPRYWLLSYRGLCGLGLIAVTFWVGWLTTKIDLGMLFGRASRSAYLWKDLVAPSFEHFATIDPKVGATFWTGTILGGMIQSIFMALLATILGGIIALPLSFLGARNIMGFSALGWTTYAVTRAFFNIFRSIESILWGIIFAVWVGFGAFAGVLALTIHTIAALGKLYSEQVESVEPGPLEAIAATGGRRWQVVLYGVVPQVVPSFLAFSLYRWDINVRMSTVIALVGGGGIGGILFYYKNAVGLLKNSWNQVGAVVLCIIIVVWLLDYISARVRERIT